MYTWDGQSEEDGFSGLIEDMVKNNRITRYTSSVSGGTPTGTVNIHDFGETETRPENIAFYYIVKGI